MITLDLTRDELVMIEIAIKFHPFQDIIQSPQTKRVTRDVYRALAEKIREAGKAKP